MAFAVLLDRFKAAGWKLVDIWMNRRGSASFRADPGLKKPAAKIVTPMPIAPSTPIAFQRSTIATSLHSLPDAKARIIRVLPVASKPSNVK